MIFNNFWFCISNNIHIHFPLGYGLDIVETDIEQDVVDGGGE